MPKIQTENISVFRNEISDKSRGKHGHVANKRVMIMRRNQLMVAAPNRPAPYKKGATRAAWANTTISTH